MAMTCFRCKAEIATGKKFCSDCGSSIDLDFKDATKATEVNTSSIQKSSSHIMKILIVLAVFGGIFVGAYSLISSGVESVTSSFSPEATPKIPESSGVLGQQVQDGQMTFLLNSQPKCFDEGSNKLCRFDISVSNHSKTAATFFDSVQKLVDVDGNFYDASSPYTRSDYSVEFTMKELNPGMSVRGFLFFELPTTVNPTTLILHDSMFSAGVAISL